MAQIVLSVSITHGVGTLNFAGAARRSGKLLPCSSRSIGTNICRFSSSRGKGIRCAVSSSSKNNGGVAEISESELAKHFHAWPDYKKPRVCILGGGFGGLYTALRLESLFWPDNKKPQVISVLFCFSPKVVFMTNVMVHTGHIRFYHVISLHSLLPFPFPVSQLVL